MVLLILQNLRNMLKILRIIQWRIEILHRIKDAEILFIEISAFFTPVIIKNSEILRD